MDARVKTEHDIRDILAKYNTIKNFSSYHSLAPVLFAQVLKLASLITLKLSSSGLTRGSIRFCLRENSFFNAHG
jgi:predicted transcriptional regulator